MKILITGGSNGMGKGVARILAAADNHSHEIILLCRSAAQGEATIREIKNASGNTSMSLVLCDLAKLSDVRKAIAEIRKKHVALDAIFINAGIGYAARRIETEDGMDSHFQVNYLSQFMLTLNLLPLLGKSASGGRVIFNATNYGKIIWDDVQLKNKWSFEQGIFQAMAAKRMFLHKLHATFGQAGKRPAFIGYQIHKTVWTNQLNIIPKGMKFMASVMKFFGTFISIEDCGQEMAPLFLEPQAESLNKSGKLFTWKKHGYIEVKENDDILDQTGQDRLWELSLQLCKDEETTRIASELLKRARDH